jgi:hypothetical protein
MELMDMVLGYSFKVGKWTASVVIKNGEKDPLKGIGSGSCKKEAVYHAINNAIKGRTSPYRGEKKNEIVDFAKKTVSETALSLSC